MSVVVLGITRLLHGTKQHHRQDISIGFPFYLLHDVLQGFLTHGTSCPINWKAKTRSIIDKLLHFLCFGFFVNPVNKGKFSFGKMLSYCLICNQHKGFNHPFCNPTLAQDDVYWFSLRIDQDFSFAGIKVQGSSFFPHSF